MGILLIIIVMVVIYNWSKASLEAKINSIDPTNVDNTKMTRDICNGVSKAEINRRYGNGYYNKR